MMIRATLALCALLTACGTTAPAVSLSGEAGTKMSQAEAHDKWTRRATVRHDYQEALRASVVLMSPEWVAAQASPHLTTSVDTQRFAVVMSTWDRAENDLDRGDQAAWRVRLIANGQAIAPLRIERVRHAKHQLQAEFPDVGDFSLVYLVHFPKDAPIFGANVDKVHLRISSARGTAQFVWTQR